jgi:hypothetical protein
MAGADPAAAVSLGGSGIIRRESPAHARSRTSDLRELKPKVRATTFIWVCSRGGRPAWRAAHLALGENEDSPTWSPHSRSCLPPQPRPTPHPTNRRVVLLAGRGAAALCAAEPHAAVHVQHGRCTKVRRGGGGGEGGEGV